MITISLATSSDIVEFYGYAKSMRAVVAKRDGIVVGIAGVVLEPLQARFFSDQKDMSCAEMIRAWRGVKRAMRFVHESRRPVVAIAENDHGHKNLTRLGFTRIEGDYYMWSGN